MYKCVQYEVFMTIQILLQAQGRASKFLFGQPNLKFNWPFATRFSLFRTLLYVIILIYQRSGHHSKYDMENNVLPLRTQKELDHCGVFSEIYDHSLKLRNL